MKNSRNLVKLVTILILVSSLLGCSALGKSEVPKDSVIGLFRDNTVYYSERVKNTKDLETKSVYLNTKEDQQQRDLVVRAESTTLRNLGGLDISVDNVRKMITLESSVEGRAKEVYDCIISGLKTDKTRYIRLYRQLVFDEMGNVSNIKLSTDGTKIEMDFSTSGEVDTRFLDMYYTSCETPETIEFNKYNEGKIVLTESSVDSDYIVFKKDAVYGIANTEAGLEMLDKLAVYRDVNISTADSDRVYRGISIDSIVDSISAKPKNSSNAEVEQLVIKELSKTSESDLGTIAVYMESETDNLGKDIIDVIESVGYHVEVVDNLDIADVSIGYTWLYNNSLQSSLDDRLNTAIINYHNNSNEPTTLRFIMMSSWGLK